MLSYRIRNVLVCVVALLLSGLQVHAAEAQTPTSQAPRVLEMKDSNGAADAVDWLDDQGDASAKEIEWDDLIPADWQPETLMKDFDAANLSDGDPKAQQLLDKLKTLWDKAPVVKALEGQHVKLAGFVVPLEMDEKKIDQFLLVPYFGACIHVPPPPASQTVYVVTRQGKGYQGRLFDVVWVTGTMRVERLTSDLGDAGYRLEDASVTPYE